MSRTSLALALVVAAIPAIASAQSSTQTQPDSERRGSSGRSRAGQQTSGERGSRRDAQGSSRTQHTRDGDIDRGDSTGTRGSRDGASRTGSGAFRGRNYGLTHDQIRQLQQAIDDRTQCDVGEADGVMGPKTRKAVSCARRELGVQGNDMAGLFSALGLEFTSDDNGGNGQGNDRDVDGSSGNRGDRDHRGNNGNNGKAGRDSTMRDSSRGQRPPR